MPWPRDERKTQSKNNYTALCAVQELFFCTVFITAEKSKHGIHNKDVKEICGGRF
jgi:hypothetical protein